MIPTIKANTTKQMIEVNNDEIDKTDLLKFGVISETFKFDNKPFLLIFFIDSSFGANDGYAISNKGNSEAFSAKCFFNCDAVNCSLFSALSTNHLPSESTDDLDGFLSGK